MVDEIWIKEAKFEKPREPVIVQFHKSRVLSQNFFSLEAWYVCGGEKKDLLQQTGGDRTRNYHPRNAPRESIIYLSEIVPQNLGIVLMEHEYTIFDRFYLSGILNARTQSPCPLFSSYTYASTWQRPVQKQLEKFSSRSSTCKLRGFSELVV